ncbi:EF-hand domain-containing protein [Sphingomonas nostoxanthinifaciens]|uniref:EF-hand domain-containing protein n=1 Tax=Sphingomonas nostoxanthinifaciens TaxID=2872652 RepID=UPI001CC1E81F|nr:EF-hand domain-containing protein [Sphingomonas nostoxanthinifaciens]UAK26693.1 hypothetical protein K8P63_14170 [Sphingomonas nostoxanthinifaciens]
MLRQARPLAPLILALAAAAAPAQQPPAAPAPPTSPPLAHSTGPDITVQGQTEPASTVPISGPTDFISPMGEPFRSDDKLSGAEHWFRHADADGNGRLTLAEFRTEGMRFFTTLDTDHDDVIGPAEISHYEVDIAPEVTVVSSYGDVTKAKQDSDGNITEPPYPTRLGAGRFSYLPMPEPITYADTNFDRGVTKLEFAKAIEIRFKMLDANGDGAITRQELPKLGSPHDNYR